eukprot:g2803.t1
MIHFLLLVSRQGKVRLTKWYGEAVESAKQQSKIIREVTSLILSRNSKMCEFCEYGDRKIVYKRYASLYFAACIDNSDNELLALEKIHMFVETLDKYFGNVCELDIIFNFHKAHYVLDEVFIGGNLVDSSRNKVVVCIREIEERVTSGNAEYLE